MGEDQDAAGSRCLDEADRSNRLARASCVFEPEPPRGARIVDDLRNDLLFGGVLLPILRFLIGIE